MEPGVECEGEPLVPAEDPSGVGELFVGPFPFVLDVPLSVVLEPLEPEPMLPLLESVLEPEPMLPVLPLCEPEPMLPVLPAEPVPEPLPDVWAKAKVPSERVAI